MSEPEVLGELLVGFQMAAATLQLALGPELEKVCDGLVADRWYPLATYQRLCALVTSAFPTPGPVFERMGVENSRMAFEQFRTMRGVDFLRFYVGAYPQFARGPVDQVGAVELVSLDEAEGKAVVKSTSVVPRDLERGFYYGGLGSLNDVGFVNIVTDHAHGLHHIEFH